MGEPDLSRAPPRWQETWDALVAMRGPGGAAYNAPVDTMGCNLLGDRAAAPEVFRFQSLVALMLSAQTKDAVTSAAMHALKTRLPGGLTIESVLAAPDELLHDCIRAVSFHNNKVRHTPCLLHSQLPLLPCSALSV